MEVVKRICPSCKEEKDWTEDNFYRRKDGSGRLLYDCILCCREKNKAWHRNKRKKELPRAIICSSNPDYIYC